MPDSVTVSDLPAGFPAYLGYTDGDFPTADALRAKFPGAKLILLSTTGTGILPPCNGFDIEPGNLTAAEGARLAAGYINGAPSSGRPRPVLYASVSGPSGYGMGDVLAELAKRSVARHEVRLLSAHYGQGAHICGPDSCGLIADEMDGTQWTDMWTSQFLTNGRRPVDMSLLAGDFFTSTPAAAPGNPSAEEIVGELPVVQQGMTGNPVRTVQGLCCARWDNALKVDGVFGPETWAAVRAIQNRAGITVDGIVGPSTWPVLLGIS